MLGIVGIVLLSLTAILVIGMVAACIRWRLRNRSQARDSRKPREMIREEDVGLLTREDFDD